MAYRKNYRRYRRTSTPRRYTNRNRSSRVKTLVDGKTAEPGFMKVLRTTGSAAAAMYPLAKTVGSVLSMINVEDKYIDTNSTVTAASGSVENLTQIAQGNGDSQRSGNKILLKDMNLNLSIVRNASATNTFVRLSVIMDKQYDGTPVTPSQLYNNTFNGSINSFLNKDYSDRFTVIKSWRINLDNVGTGNQLRKLYVKLPIHVNYSGATATNQKENQIFLVITHDQGSNFPTVSYNSRIRYYDN